MKERIKLNKEGKNLEEILGFEKGSIESLDEKLEVLANKIAYSAIDKMEANNPSIFIGMGDVIEGLLDSFTEKEILAIASSYVMKQIIEPFDAISKKENTEPTSALDKMLEEMSKFR